MFTRVPHLFLAQILLATQTSLLIAAQSPPAREDSRDPASVSGYLPTPLAVADKMLEIAKVLPGERVYDLGSGDGRIVIRAAQKFDALGVGIELHPDLCRLARNRVREAGLAGKVTIIEGSFFDQDLSRADVVIIYLDPRAMSRVGPLVEKHLRHGMRVVALESEIPGWQAASVTKAQDSESGRTYQIFLYEVSRPGAWYSFGNFGQTPSGETETPKH